MSDGENAECPHSWPSTYKDVNGVLEFVNWYACLTQMPVAVSP